VSEFNEPIGSEAPNGVSRRTVTKAMAWAVPVIAVSAAVPAYAASQIIINFSGSGCKLPGNSNPTYKGYAFLLSISNSSTVPVTIDVISITLGGASLGTTALVNLPPSPNPGTLRPDPFTLAIGESLPAAALVTTGAPNSQNNTLQVQFTINGGVVQTRTVTVPSVQPINGASCTAFNAAQKLILGGVLGAGVPPWESNHVYVVGDIVRVPGGILSATTGGTSGTTPPAYPAAGTTVTDGTVVWQRASDAE